VLIKCRKEIIKYINPYIFQPF